VFVMSSYAISSAGRGLDLDGACGSRGCADNALAFLATFMNDQLRQALLGGELMTLIEVSGLDEPYSGNDDSVTVKIYDARDADDPFFPANNFTVPVGETVCCQFRTATTTPYRVAARVRDRRLTTLAPFDLRFPIVPDFDEMTQRVPPLLTRARLTAFLPLELDFITEVQVGGAYSMTELARSDNPFCRFFGSNALCPNRTAETTLLDLMARMSQPDIDLDDPPDGLETLDPGFDDRVSQCRDACDTGSCPVVKPLDPLQPWSCALDPRMGDGFSIGLDLSGPAATIVQ